MNDLRNLLDHCGISEQDLYRHLITNEAFVQWAKERAAEHTASLFQPTPEPPVGIPLQLSRIPNGAQRRAEELAAEVNRGREESRRDAQASLALMTRIRR